MKDYKAHLQVFPPKVRPKGDGSGFDLHLDTPKCCVIFANGDNTVSIAFDDRNNWVPPKGETYSQYVAELEPLYDDPVRLNNESVNGGVGFHNPGEKVLLSLAELYGYDLVKREE